MAYSKLQHTKKREKREDLKLNTALREVRFCRKNCWHSTLFSQKKCFHISSFSILSVYEGCDNYCQQ